MRANGDCRDDDDKATEAHIERMRQTFLFLDRVEGEIARLHEAKRHAERTICEALGVKVGEVAETTRKRVLATRVKGGFHFGIGAKDGQVIACVEVVGNKALVSGRGFHTRHVDAVTVFDDGDHWFPAKTPYNPDA